MLKSKMIVASGIGAALGVTAALLATGCGKADSSNVSVRFGSYVARNPLMEMFLPSAYAALSGTKICFKRVRFKADLSDTLNPATDPSNVDFEPGEISLNAASPTVLGAVLIPAGTYRRVEFDLQKDGLNCTSGNSVTMTNANGGYVSQDSITIKFEGNFVASAASEQLTLGLQAIVNALNAVSGVSSATSSNGMIKANLEAASVVGNF